MRALRHLTLLLTLLTPMALADGLYQVELILFRQAAEPISAGQVAPDDWAGGAPALAAESLRGISLDSEAARLTPDKGYQVLLHKAWQQNLSATPSKVALSEGTSQFGHAPIEGTLSLQQARFVDVQADFWINQFSADGLLSGSERLKQSNRLKTGELTFLDHGHLGLLIKVSPL
ncbi:MAG: CsiV family protein [Pseudomonas sp.]|uniref:CsiV family protein n=1 Tax=Pseudomonas sp. TaxID=306 RepID=UPI003398E39C